MSTQTTLALLVQTIKTFHTNTHSPDLGYHNYSQKHVTVLRLPRSGSDFNSPTPSSWIGYLAGQLGVEYYQIESVAVIWAPPTSWEEGNEDDVTVDLKRHQCRVTVLGEDNYKAVLKMLALREAGRDVLSVVFGEVA